MLLHNAQLISSHDETLSAKANSIFIENNQIKAIGRFDELKALCHSGTEIIDVKGKTIMPSFIDSHIHIWKVGNLISHILDVRGVKSKDDLLEMLSNYIKINPDKTWIIARGFNEGLWKDKSLPTKVDLDKVSSSKPIYIIRTCAHIAVCNSKTLEIAKINHLTISADGGVIYKDINGKPNGIISETALGLVTKYIPAYTKTDLKIMVKAAEKELLKFGITAATDPAVDPNLLEVYHELHYQNNLGIRVNAFPIVIPDGGLEPYPIPNATNTNWLKVNTVKFFSDGGLSGKTAALNANYKNETSNGVLRLNPKSYLELCKKATEKGFRIATHAIGDRGIDLVIDTYKKLSAIHSNQLNRIEHLGLPSAQNLNDMLKYNIATSMQSIFINELGQNFRAYLNDNYLDRCYPIKTVSEAGILTALSSDAPVVKNLNPFKGIESAITRKDAEGNFIAKSESISAQEAIKLYTKSAATISHHPNIGSLEIGNFADFIILNKNPLSVKTESLNDIMVEKTYLNGKCVYNNEKMYASL